MDLDSTFYFICLILATVGIDEYYDDAGSEFIFVYF